MKTKILLIIIIFASLCFSCITKKKESKISVTYSVQKVNNEVLKMTLVFKNNDLIDYFIPFIKPVYNYLEVTDEKHSPGIQVGIDVNYFLSSKLLTRKDLIETAEIDSAFYDKATDSLHFYFENSSIKNVYDSILLNFKNKDELHFIYPYFYHAIANGCVYLRKGDTKEVFCYVRHQYPLDPDKLLVSFNFDTRNVSDYREKYFASIPSKIGTFHRFDGKINN